MRSKILFIVGLAVGYVLGTRAGRERYEQIRRQAEKVWTSPTVQTQVHRAQEFAKERAPEVVEQVEEGIRKLSEQVKARRTPPTEQAGS